MEEWRKKAICKDMDPSMFYPHTEEEVGTGVALCHTCPVMLECRDYSFEHKEKEGTWGGISQWDRRRIVKRLQRERYKERKEQESLKSEQIAS